jgi:hypothetical protein
VSETIYDPEWDGLVIEREAPCDHGLKLRKFVAFEGTNTKKSILGCAKEVWMIYKINFLHCVVLCSFNSFLYLIYYVADH